MLVPTVLRLILVRLKTGCRAEPSRRLEQVYTMCVYRPWEALVNARDSEPLELTVFKSGNSSALRLPKALDFEPGERVVAFREGEALILRHADAKGWPVGYFVSWEASTIELPERSKPESRDARMKRLFGEKGSF